MIINILVNDKTFSKKYYKFLFLNNQCCLLYLKHNDITKLNC